MAAIAFDPLEYAHQLEASGVSREQAEVHAKAMTAMFLYNFDALVTKDYLDTRFSEFETRVEAKMDKRFAEVDQRLAEMNFSIDQRFAEMNSSMDQRFAEIKSSVEKRFAGIDVRFERVDGKFRILFWMQALTIACVVMPVLRDFIR